VSNEERVVVEPDDAGRRLDVFVADHFAEVSRSHAAVLIRDGLVTVDGAAVRASQKLATGQTVSARILFKPAISAAPEAIPLRIVYEDADMAIVDKPAGMVVHPAPGHAGGTLANALAARFPATSGVGNEDRPGIVHRLDRDTSGLMVVALTPAAHSSLQQQIASRSAGRRYIALVRGHLSRAEGAIEAPIGRDPNDRKRMAAHGIAARDARTSYRALESLDKFQLVEATLHTGRTHQIRVHFAAAGHPVAGDTVYGGPPLSGLDRHFLHAFKLTVNSPSTGEEKTFFSDLPEELYEVLAALGSRFGPGTFSGSETSL
jgi:23S rRNA pseudouridine1911/1915/1917 synthase